MVQISKTGMMISKTGMITDQSLLWIVYTCEFRARFRIKLARFAKKFLSLLNVQA